MSSSNLLRSKLFAKYDSSVAQDSGRFSRRKTYGDPSPLRKKCPCMPLSGVLSSLSPDDKGEACVASIARVLDDLGHSNPQDRGQLDQLNTGRSSMSVFLDVLLNTLCGLHCLFWVPTCAGTIGPLWTQGSRKGTRNLDI